MCLDVLYVLKVSTKSRKNMDTLKEFFDMWRQAAVNARYDRWCEEHVDELIEEACHDYCKADD